MAAKKKSTTTSTRPTGMSASEKEARSALYQADVAGLEAAQVRTSRASRGSYSQRRLRASGTDLSGYLIGGYKDDPLPRGTGGGTGGGGRSTTPKPPKPPKKPKVPKKPKAPKPTTHKQAVKKQTKLSDARSRSLADARARAAAALAAKRRAAAKKAVDKAKANYAKAQAKKKIIAPAGKAPKAV